MTRAEASQTVRSLYLSWYSTAVRYAFRACGSLEAAEDLVQEAFQALYVELVNGQDVDDPRRWTLCVIRRGVGKLFRSRKAHGEELLPSEEFETMADTHTSTPEELFARDELFAMMSSLSRREEEVLLLRVSGLRYREIADDLDISQNSVKTLLARALKKLRLSAGQPGSEKQISLNDASGISKTLH